MPRAAKVRVDHDEIRGRILAVAEEMFRRVGYQKTAVADIAAALSMSPANVYRFFPSKSAISEAICQRVVDEIVDIAWSFVRRQGTAAERIQAMLVTLFRHNRDTMFKERRVHDMVSAALEERWPVIKEHLARLTTIIESLIREGIDAGEFEVNDPQCAAECVKVGFAAFLHPVLIEQNLEDDAEIKARVQAGFLVDALRPRAR